VENAVTIYNHVYNKYKLNLNKPQQSTDNNETRCDATASAQTAQEWCQLCAFIWSRKQPRINGGETGFREGGYRISENWL